MEVTCAAGATSGFIYAGAALIHPQATLRQTGENPRFNRYLTKRLPPGGCSACRWRKLITVGTPDAIAPRGGSSQSEAGKE